MRTPILLILTVFLTFPALAEDGFGARFTGRSPSALEVPAAVQQNIVFDEIGQDLQDIAPAAGETEEKTETPSFEILDVEIVSEK